MRSSSATGVLVEKRHQQKQRKKSTTLPYNVPVREVLKKSGCFPFPTRTCCRISTWFRRVGGGTPPPGSPPRDPWRSCGAGPTMSRPPSRTRVLCSPASSSLLRRRRPASTSRSWGSPPPQPRPRNGGGVPRSRRPCRRTASAALGPVGAGRTTPGGEEKTTRERAA